MQNLNKQMRAFYAWQERHSLSTVAIALYYTLLNHADKCNSMEFSVAISTLAKHTGMSERSVFRARELLSNHNLIHIEQTAYRDCARYTIHSLQSNDSDTKSDSMTHSRTVRHQVIQCDTKSPLTSHTQTCTSIIVNNDSMYSKFNIWLEQNAPRVQQMRQPITEAQLQALVSQYSKHDVMEILLAMENYADLHKKNISAYLTARAWLKRRIQVPQRQDPFQTKPGKVDTMLNILQRISNDDATNNNCNTTDPIMLED